MNRCRVGRRVTPWIPTSRRSSSSSRILHWRVHEGLCWRADQRRIQGLGAGRRGQRRARKPVTVSFASVSSTLTAIVQHRGRGGADLATGARNGGYRVRCVGTSVRTGGGMVQSVSA
jgi:hypothetical protein